MAHTHDFLTEEQLEEFRAVFDMLDQKGTGRIPIRELKNIIRTLDSSTKSSEIKLMTKIISKKGTVDFGFEDFVNAMTQRMRTSEIEDELHRAFKIFDKDGDGFISGQELRHFMTNMGEKYTDKEIEEMIKVADADNKGKVNFQDYIRMITQS